jgi:hypothetical protein
MLFKPLNDLKPLFLSNTTDKQKTQLMLFNLNFFNNLNEPFVLFSFFYLKLKKTSETLLYCNLSSLNKLFILSGGLDTRVQRFLNLDDIYPSLET